MSVTQVIVFNGGGSSSTCLNIDMKMGENLKIEDVADVTYAARKIISNEGVSASPVRGKGDFNQILNEGSDYSVEKYTEDKIVEMISQSKRVYIDKNKNVIFEMMMDNSSGDSFEIKVDGFSVK